MIILHRVLIVFLSILYLHVALHNAWAIERPDFNSYEEAIVWVRSTNSLIKDSVDTSKSSWIRSAEYYSDGLGIGFLILNMKGKEYIWEGVPLNVWKGFKKADSFGKYYHRYIKGNYYMELEQ
jgi:hypothetical protein